jgi:hypothetical protein
VDAVHAVPTGCRAHPPRGRRRTAPPRLMATVAPAAPGFAKPAAAALTPPSPLHGPTPRAHFCPRPCTVAVVYLHRAISAAAELAFAASLACGSVEPPHELCLDGTRLPYRRSCRGSDPSHRHCPLELSHPRWSSSIPPAAPFFLLSISFSQVVALPRPSEADGLHAWPRHG